jgi:tellurite resistance protein
MECILPKDINKLARRAEADREAEASRQPVRLEDYEQGGFVEAAHRLINLVCSADGEYDRMEFAEAERIVLSSETLRGTAPRPMKEIIRRQARLVWTNRNLALKTIPLLVSDPGQRRELYEMGVKIAKANGKYDRRERALLDRLKKILLLED